MTYTGDLYVYDGDCAICSRFVRFLVANDPDGRFALATAQSETGRAIYREEGLDPDAMETALLRIDGKTYRNLDVFTETMVALGGIWKLAGVLRALPRSVSDWLYRRIANNRKRFQRAACPLPTPEIRARFLD